jgi:hypothetical protein
VSRTASWQLKTPWTFCGLEKGEKARKLGPNDRDEAHKQAHVERDKRTNAVGRLLIALSLFGLLAGAVWYAVDVWTVSAGPPMPTAAYVAMALGVGFSIVIGGGLMALLFYSNRHGYDEGAKGDHEPD